MKSAFQITITLLLISLNLNLAKAGDFASREILGFSKDGSLFAFEEYGIQDGSGFPYSSIYLINTSDDSWTLGSPYRARIDSEGASVTDARSEARRVAGVNLDAITETGTVNATNQPLEVVEDPMRMVARPWHFVPPTSDRIEFQLEAISMKGADYCSAFGETFGFRLKQMPTEPDQQVEILHEDSNLPKSRGCPLSYRFADIVTYRAESTDTYVKAVLILYETVGFEGPDGRFIAVTSTSPLNP